MASVNRQWKLVNYPAETPTDRDVALEESAIPVPKEGEVLIRVGWLSVDPYMRGTMRQRAYGMVIPLGSVLTATGVGRVETSHSPKFAVGDLVVGRFGWQDYSVKNAFDPELQKVPAEAPPSYFLGALGMPGATAYFGFLELCAPKPGDVVFVTAASGAVGALVGQIAKIMGCYVVGSAGGPAKVAYCLKLGFDACIDYKGKDTATLEAELREVTRGGIDCFFDNTGGPASDAALLCMKQFGRVSVCGQIAVYNEKNQKEILGAPVLYNLLAKQVRAEGFIVSRWKDWTPAQTRIGTWIREGKIKVEEDVTEGLENMFSAFLSLFSGENLGKKLIKVRDL